jgi:hypothetical protein
MALPKAAKVEAVPNFLANIEAAAGFFRLQDADSAEARLTKLKSSLREMVTILSWSPASGRPARFLSLQSAQGRLRLQSVMALANSAGLPELREYIVDRHVVLYAHSESEVLLLALKHQRELVYSA